MRIIPGHLLHQGAEWEILFQDILHLFSRSPRCKVKGFDMSLADNIQPLLPRQFRNPKQIWFTCCLDPKTIAPQPNHARQNGTDHHKLQRGPYRTRPTPSADLRANRVGYFYDCGEYHRIANCRPDHIANRTHQEDREHRRPIYNGNGKVECEDKCDRIQEKNVPRTFSRRRSSLLRTGYLQPMQLCADE